MKNLNFKKKLYKYGCINNYDILKNIAFIFMVIDHVGYFLFPQIDFLRFLGRFSSPIFLTLYGYSYKKEKNNFFLLLFGFLSSVIIYILDDFLFPLNILITMYICGKIINVFDIFYKKNCVIFIIFYVSMLFPSLFFLGKIFDYGYLAIMLTYAGHLMKQEKKDSKILFLIIFSFIFFALIQMLSFDLHLKYTIFYFPFMFFLLKMGCNFNKNIKKSYNIKNKFLNYPVLIISRYSVFLYFLHLLIILLIKTWFF